MPHPVHYKLHEASGLNVPWSGTIEWNMEENFKVEWKVLSIEQKFPVWNMEKSSSIPCPACNLSG